MRPQHLFGVEERDALGFLAHPHEPRLHVQHAPHEPGKPPAATECGWGTRPPICLVVDFLTPKVDGEQVASDSCGRLEREGTPKQVTSRNRPQRFLVVCPGICCLRAPVFAADIATNSKPPILGIDPLGSLPSKDSIHPFKDCSLGWQWGTPTFQRPMSIRSLRVQRCTKWLKSPNWGVNKFKQGYPGAQGSKTPCLVRMCDWLLHSRSYNPRRS